MEWVELCSQTSSQSSPLFLRDCLPHDHMADLPPVGQLICTRDVSNECGVVFKLQELDGLVTGGTAVCVQREEQKGKKAAWSEAGAVLSDRKSMIQLQVKSGRSWSTLSRRRAGTIILNTELCPQTGS